MTIKMKLSILETFSWSNMTKNTEKMRKTSSVNTFLTMKTTLTVETEEEEGIKEDLRLDKKERSKTITLHLKN